MIRTSMTCFLLALVLAIRSLLGSAELTVEECGDVQHNVENGMIRLPDFSGENIRNLNCSWTYTAPPDRKLLVKVDSVHLPPLDLRVSQLQLYVDDVFYDIPRNCVKCLREMVGGQVLKVVFTSEVAPASEARAETSNDTAVWEGIGSFQVRYKAFDPHHCNKPEAFENGFTISEGRKLGQSIFYYCIPPYDLIGESEATCVVAQDTPVPEWTNKPPKCLVEECTGEPIVKSGSSGAIASPGYPSYLHHFSAPCFWEVIAQPSQQIKVSVSYLRFPNHFGNSLSTNPSRLSLIDGGSNYIVNLTESLTNGSLNFTTLTNKLTVELVINEEHAQNEEVGFYMDYSVISSSCPKPSAPANGEIIAFSNDLGSTIAYRCAQGFVLVGELHAECLLNGKWSHPPPTCEPLNNHMPPFLSASNDSDTVTAELSEIQTPESPKNSKDEKKINILSPRKTIANSSDAHDKSVSSERKVVLNSSETKDKFSVPKDKKMPELIPMQNETRVKIPTANGKKSGKESGNGPKSEPHLLQVVPPKENGKKTTNTPSVIVPTRVNKSSDVTKILEPVPTFGTDYYEEIEIFGFKLSLTIIYVIAGVGIPLVIGIIILLVIIIYRKKYPVRMRFGRKFSTFENPMYVTKDAQHPRELKRLTN